MQSSGLIGIEDKIAEERKKLAETSAAAALQGESTSAQVDVE